MDLDELAERARKDFVIAVRLWTDWKPGTQRGLEAARDALASWQWYQLLREAQKARQIGMHNDLSATLAAPETT
jgi:hypothetical protein